MDEDRQELEISQVDTQINEEAYEQNLNKFSYRIQTKSLKIL